MAKAITELFEGAGCRVIGSDLKNPSGLTSQEVAQQADVLFVSILPISRVATVILDLVPYVRRGALLLHGTSVQNPVLHPISPVLLDDRLVQNGVTTGFCHLKFGPSVGSFRGQAVIFGLLNEPEKEWRPWLLNILKGRQMRVLLSDPTSHDLLTTSTQVVPMISSLVNGHVWRSGSFNLGQVLDVAGPPAVLQMLGVLRNLSQPRVLAEILVNHPGTAGVIKKEIEALQMIREACRNGDVAFISQLAEEELRGLPESRQATVRAVTDWHIRTEGDLRGGAICFQFQSAENRIGLLSDVLLVFDQHQLQKTSCMAQEIPGGDCIFYIGLKDIESPQVEIASQEILEKYGGKIVAVSR